MKNPDNIKIIPTPHGRNIQRLKQQQVFASMLEIGTANWEVCPARIMSTAVSESARNANLDFEQVIDAGISAFDNATQVWRGHCRSAYECPLVLRIIDAIGAFVEVTAALAEPTPPCTGGTNE